MQIKLYKWYIHIYRQRHIKIIQKYKTRKEIEKCVNCWLAWQIIIHAVTKNINGEINRLTNNIELGVNKKCYVNLIYDLILTVNIFEIY